MKTNAFIKHVKYKLQLNISGITITFYKISSNPFLYVDNTEGFKQHNRNISTSIQVVTGKQTD